jgi:hypothetical protein
MPELLRAPPATRVEDTGRRGDLLRGMVAGAVIAVLAMALGLVLA